MTLLLLALAWFGLGGFGALLAYRGSMRDYGRDIYGPAVYAVTVLSGLSGFVGSMAAW